MREAKKIQNPAKPSDKRPFDIEEALRHLREATAPFPKAALFELAAEGYDSVFEILIACIISIRTRDEVTLPVSRELFAKARTPAAVANLSESKIDALIRRSTYHEPKAKTIRTIAREAVEQHGGNLPCDLATQLEFRGVGPKCANLVLGIACGRKQRGIPKRNEYNVSVALRETRHAVRNLPALSPPVHRSNTATTIDGASEETPSETPTDRRPGDVSEVQRRIPGEYVNADDGWDVDAKK